MKPNMTSIWQTSKLLIKTEKLNDRKMSIQNSNKNIPELMWRIFRRQKSEVLPLTFFQLQVHGRNEKVFVGRGEGGNNIPCKPSNIDLALGSVQRKHHDIIFVELPVLLFLHQSRDSGFQVGRHSWRQACPIHWRESRVQKVLQWFVPKWTHGRRNFSSSTGHTNASKKHSGPLLC